jgi:methionyl aminopeptidase
VHGIGSQRVIQPGEIVKVDVGVIKDGWVGDNATTVAAGGISPQARKLLEVTEASLYKGLEKAVPGNRLREVSRAIEAHVLQNGMSIVKKYVGHGVGRKMHEEPQVPNYVTRGSSPRLKPGMVLAIEPMVNAGGEDTKELNDGWTVVTVDGSLSAHFEHTVHVTKDGPEILTLRDKPRFCEVEWVDKKISQKNEQKCLPGN